MEHCLTNVLKASFWQACVMHIVHAWPCRSAEVVASSLSSMLAYAHNTGSVSLYMAHGGTSFGFWAGCNGEQFDVTSYDYNCPISESGNTGQPGVGGANKFQVSTTAVVVFGLDWSVCAQLRKHLSFWL